MEADLRGQNAVDVDLSLRFCQAEQSWDQRALPSAGPSYDTNLTHGTENVISFSSVMGTVYVLRGQTMTKPSPWAWTWLSGSAAPPARRCCSRSWPGQRSPGLCWANQVGDASGFPRVLRSPVQCTPPLSPLTSSEDRRDAVHTFKWLNFVYWSRTSFHWYIFIYFTIFTNYYFKRLPW